MQTNNPATLLVYDNPASVTLRKSACGPPVEDPIASASNGASEAARKAIGREMAGRSGAVRAVSSRWRVRQEFSHAVLAGESFYKGSDYIMSLKTPKQVQEISAALAGMTEEEFHERYLRIETKSYGFPLSEEDFQSTWEWFQAVRKLYGKAAKEGRFVLFTADQ